MIKFMANKMYCPITKEIMLKPYVAADGFTYEKWAINNWLKNNSVSPITGKIIGKEIYPNNVIKIMIKVMIEKYPKLGKKQFKGDEYVEDLINDIINKGNYDELLQIKINEKLKTINNVLLLYRFFLNCNDIILKHFIGNILDL